jgi:SAM-dependent methyltransferase
MTATEPVDRHVVMPMGGRIKASFSELFSDALRGMPCSVRGIAAADQVMPVHTWLRTASHADRRLLGHCRGATLDIGCGPGRMGAYLQQQGHSVLAVDIVDEAVDQARRRGVAGLRRNVFDAIPGEGNWDTVLLADGNIGIGGSPLALLRRAVELLDREGRVVCDLATPGTGLRVHAVRLVTHRHHSDPFPWAEVGPEAIGPLALQAGLRVLHLRQRHGRWFAVLTR